MKAPKKIQNTHYQGFTLVELLTVIAIIVILAGLSVAGMGWANSKALKEKTVTQLRLLENGMQQYFSDIGSYPKSTGNGSAKESLFVYAMCYGDTNDQGVVGGRFSPKWRPNDNATVYISELDPTLEGNTWFDRTPNPTGLIDPYGRFWHYRSGQSRGMMNPDFDLWSIGAKDRGANHEEDNITNW